MWSDDGFVVRVSGGRSASGQRAVRCPTRTRSSGWWCGSSGPRRCSPPAFARPRAAPCCCRAAGRARARRCGSSASAPRTCWRWPSRFGSFPIILETYRECLRDIFDLPALVDLLTRIRSRAIRVDHGGRPHAVAVRRVAAVRLRRQLHLRRRCAAGRAAGAGAVGRSVAAARADRRRRAARPARRRRAGGDRARRCSTCPSDSTRARPTPCTICCCGSATCRARSCARAPRRASPRRPSPSSLTERRVLRRARRRRGAADRGRRRGALSRRAGHAAAPGPARIAARDGRPTPWPIWCGATRARTARSRRRTWRHASGSVPPWSRPRCSACANTGRVIEGEFRPGGHGREWCDAEVLRSLRRRSLARLRQEVEPVEPQVLGRFLIVVARHRAAAARPRRAARRDRAAAGRAAGRLGARTAHPAGAHRSLRSVAARHADLAPAK